MHISHCLEFIPISIFYQLKCCTYSETAAQHRRAGDSFAGGIGASFCFVTVVKRSSTRASSLHLTAGSLGG
jgi:hypothetical protein